MPDLGVNLAAFTVAPRLGVPQALDVVRRAFELGYRSCWTPEASGVESFAFLATCGASAPGLDLGTAIVPVQVRSPLLAAMGAATLQVLHPDRRIVLGVGISSPVVTSRWHGTPYGDHPVSRMREYLLILRQLLDGQRVDHDGPFYSLSGSQLRVPLGDRRPQLALAALNPGMLRLAGERADGVLLNYLPASHVPACIDEVRRGEARAGREPGSCRIYACIHMSVTPRTDETLERGRREIFSYAITDAYGNALRRAGFSDEITALHEAHIAMETERRRLPPSATGLLMQSTLSDRLLTPAVTWQLICVPESKRQW